jgi:lipoprotein-releasing system permease protein
LYGSKKSRAINFITNISIVGVTLGVMALIIVLSIMNGFEEDLKKALIGANAHLTLSSFSQGGEQKILYDEKTIQNIKQAIPTKHISPYSLDQALVSSKSKVHGILLKGIDINTEISGAVLQDLIKKKSKSGALKISKAEFANIMQDLALQKRTNEEGDEENIAGIIIGSRLANTLNLKKGDSLTVLTTQQKISPFGVIPQKRKFVISGFFVSGLSGYDEVFTLIDLKEAKKLFGRDDYINGYAIYLDKIKDTEVMQSKVMEFFPFPHFVSSWIDDNYNLFAVLKLEKFGLSVILFFIILVAAFNIISSLIILVSEKKKDIAILKAIGTTNSAIRNIFLLQGSIIGFLGIFLGTLLGLLVCFFLKNFSIIKIPQGVYVTDTIPILVEWWQVALILIISFISCFFVTYLPAKKASSGHPVEGLKL